MSDYAIVGLFLSGMITLVILVVSIIEYLLRSKESINYCFYYQSHWILKSKGDKCPNEKCDFNTKNHD